MRYKEKAKPRLLKALRRGPQSTYTLNRIHTRFSARFFELRGKGYVIDKERKTRDGDVYFIYTLVKEPEDA